jgi:nucleotide-binding universal stress UspA family protein
MQVGPPVLIVPRAADKLKLERVVVAWKDTRETRRAAFDALPLLKKAAHVAVVEIVAEEEMAAARTHIEDVIAWLKRHGVVAVPVASLSTGDDATRLNTTAHEQGADVIVAGAYGHNRLREWAARRRDPRSSVACRSLLARVALNARDAAEEVRGKQISPIG